MRIVTCLTCALFAAGCAGNQYSVSHVPRDPTEASAALEPAISIPVDSTSAEDSITGLPELLRLADQNNPAIDSARHQVQAAAGGAWQSSLYPNPSLELEAEDNPADDPGFNRSTNKVGIVQPLVLGGKRAAAVAAASAEIPVARYQLESTRRTVHADVALAFVDLLYWREASGLHEELLSSVTETHRIAQVRYDARALLEADLLKARVEAEQLRLGLRRIQRRRAEARNKLEALVGPDIPWSNLSGQLIQNSAVPDLSTLERNLGDSHPDVLAAQRKAHRAERRLNLARREAFPDVGLRLAYGRNTEENNDIIEAGIQIPLPLFNRNQGRIKQAQHEAEAARQQTESVHRELLRELAEIHADYQVAVEDVRALQADILPAATKGWEQAQAGFEAGRFGFLDLLDAQRTLVNARLLLLDSIRDLNTAWIRLGQLAGPLTPNTPLEDNHRG